MAPSTRVSPTVGHKVKGIGPRMGTSQETVREMTVHSFSSLTKGLQEPCNCCHCWEEKTPGGWGPFFWRGARAKQFLLCPGGEECGYRPGHRDLLPLAAATPPGAGPTLQGWTQVRDS